MRCTLAAGSSRCCLRASGFQRLYCFNAARQYRGRRTPEILSPEASTFLSLSGLTPLLPLALLIATAVSSKRIAAAGVVSGDKRKIHGMFVEVSFLSPLSAITGTNALSASCSAK